MRFFVFLLVLFFGGVALGATPMCPNCPNGTCPAAYTYYLPAIPAVPALPAAPPNACTPAGSIAPTAAVLVRGSARRVLFPRLFPRPH